MSTACAPLVHNPQQWLSAVVVGAAGGPLHAGAPTVRAAGGAGEVVTNEWGVPEARGAAGSPPGAQLRGGLADRLGGCQSGPPPAQSARAGDGSPRARRVRSANALGPLGGAGDGCVQAAPAGQQHGRLQGGAAGYAAGGAGGAAEIDESALLRGLLEGSADLSSSPKSSNVRPPASVSARHDVGG